MVLAWEKLINELLIKNRTSPIKTVDKYNSSLIGIAINIPTILFGILNHYVMFKHLNIMLIITKIKGVIGIALSLKEDTFSFEIVNKMSICIIAGKEDSLVEYTDKLGVR